MRNFRLLRADEIECRISEIDRNGRYLKLLLYKTARTDTSLLDETYGVNKWQNDFKMLNDRLYCGIAVNFGGEFGEWVWKWDCGTESNMEAEKGQASDAFKRAGFKWGIGAELYSAPDILVYAEAANIKEWNGKYRCYDKFTVQEIEYDDREDISRLVIYNENTHKTCFTWRKGTTAKPETPKEPEKFICADCGAVLKPFTSPKGKTYGVRELAERSKTKHGRVLCTECAQKVADNEG